jgi:hypothetical protein
VGPSADCSAVDVSPGDPAFTMNLIGASENATCWFARPDDLDGTIPLARATPPVGGGASDWLFVQSTTGHTLSEQNSAIGMMLTQPQGFALIDAQNDPQSAEWIVKITNFAHDGSVTSQQGSGGDLNPVFVVDPSGGIVIITGTASPTGVGPWQLQYQRLDRNGVPEAGRVQFASGTSTTNGGIQAVSGVTLTSHTLVVYRWDNKCEAIWLGRGGEALTQPFAVPNCKIQKFYPLLDAGLAVETFDAPTLVTHLESEVRDGQTQWDPPPDYLAGKNLREFFMLPGGRGYALRENGTDASLHTFAPSGNACAAVTRPELADGPLTIGRDGTLLIQDLRNKGCTFYWWPQLWR